MKWRRELRTLQYFKNGLGSHQRFASSRSGCHRKSGAMEMLPDDSCLICFLPWPKSTAQIQLPCGHCQWHKSCIQRWLGRRAEHKGPGFGVARKTSEGTQVTPHSFALLFLIDCSGLRSHGLECLRRSSCPLCRCAAPDVLPLPQLDARLGFRVQFFEGFPNMVGFLVKPPAFPWVP